MNGSPPSSPVSIAAIQFREPPANPLVQFRGRRLREGHDKNLIGVQVLFEQQPHVQRADVPRLAGSRRRLDLVDAVERTGEDVEFFATSA